MNEEKTESKSHRRKVALREFVHAILSRSSCVDCGSKTSLTFDHVRGEKTRTISRMVSHKNSIWALKQEIKKCDVRCWPCHAVKHYHETLSGCQEK